MVEPGFAAGLFFHQQPITRLLNTQQAHPLRCLITAKLAHA